MMQDSLKILNNSILQLEVIGAGKSPFHDSAPEFGAGHCEAVADDQLKIVIKF